MKILYLSKDEARVKVDTADDLWHLSRLIEPDDFVAGEIVRKVKIGREEERARLKREVYFVKIKTEKVIFEPSAVRIVGTIAEGPEELPLGSHHTLDIQLGDTIKIFKAWKPFQVKRLKEAEAATKMPSVAVCVLDDEAANLAELTPTGIKYLAQLQLGLAKKRFTEKVEERMGKLVAAVAEIAKSHDIVIIASPLFWKEEVLKRLKEKHEELIDKIKLEDISMAGKRGIIELLKRGALDKVVKGTALQREFELVELFMAEVGKESKLAIYKLPAIKEAAAAGAVKILLVTEKLIERYRELKKYNELAELFDAVEATRGEIHIINSKYEAGEKLDGLGGLGAILRFKI
ncbi:MAG: mRNA surveillance protein pelota [Candidatus Nanoarchaeia archaeon]